MTTPLWAAFPAFVLALAFVRALCSERLAGLVLDIPNDRSLHARPVPRTGGLGLVMGAMLTLLAFDAGPVELAVPAIGLSAVFLMDDVRGLPVPLRFAVQFAAAAAVLFWTGPYPLWLLPVLATSIVWSVNLYNFMDGSNGLAGGMAVIGFGAYAIAAQTAGDSDLALIAGVLAGASAGFLVWNADPARIFLGDAGSIPLGFLAAAIGVVGWQRGIWPFWLPPLVFSPFAVDATVTLFRRLARGETPWQAHRNHYYQRLIRSGWSHRRLAFTAYAVMVAAAASALSYRSADADAAAVLLGCWLAAYVAFGVAIDRRWAAAEAKAPLADRVSSPEVAQ